MNIVISTQFLQNTKQRDVEVSEIKNLSERALKALPPYGRVNDKFGATNITIRLQLDNNFVNSYCPKFLTLILSTSSESEGKPSRRQNGRT